MSTDDELKNHKDFIAQKQKFLDADKARLERQLREERQGLDPAAAVEAAKDEMMEAIMPYVRILTNMVEEQAVKIKDLETQVRSLQQQRPS